MVDMVNRPPHYLVGGIEAIDVIKSRLTKAILAPDGSVTVCQVYNGTVICV